MTTIPLKVGVSSAAASERGRWSPYVINGGTVLAVAGDDFVVVAGDTRMSFDYSIASREVSKLHKLTDHVVLATAGMQAEAVTLRKVLDSRLAWYRHQHLKPMSVGAVSQLLSTTLYNKRFFPYYTFNVLAGVDAAGKGYVYGYDAVGSFESIPYGVTGSGSALITSLLDNQVEFKTQPSNLRKLSRDEVVALVKDAFTVCGERDIYTGDSVDLCIITKDGIQRESFALKKD